MPDERELGSSERLAREPRVLLGDLTCGLIWPRLLHAIPMSLRAERLGLGVATVVAMAMIAGLSSLWGEEGAIADAIGQKLRALGAILGGVWATGADGPDPNSVAIGFRALFALPGRLFDQYPVTMLALSLPLALVWVVAGCAIARSTACEFCARVVVSWPKALGFGISKWRSLLGAMYGPGVFVALLVGVLAITGWVGLGIPVVHVAGALLYGLALLIGLIGVLLLVLYAISAPLLVPAIACEGTDALDAIQRAFAYVRGRPLRLVIYATILIIQGLVGFALMQMLAGAVVDFSGWATSLLLGETGTQIVSGVPGPSGEALDGTAGAAGRVVRFWTAIPSVLVTGFVVSYYFTASTMLYLLCRKVNDGQDIDELWMPGMAPGTLGETGDGG